jgi:hypothetical protein
MSLFTKYLESEDFKFIPGKKLMIDDQVILSERVLPKGWFNLATYKASINYFLSKGIPEFITFDNDLGELKEGIDIVNWLIEKDLDFNFLNHNFKFNIHSKNIEANRRMFNKLNDYKKYRKYNYSITQFTYLSKEWKYL